jgi:hypothetical protein
MAPVSAGIAIQISALVKFYFKLGEPASSLEFGESVTRHKHTAIAAPAG